MDREVKQAFSADLRTQILCVSHPKGNPTQFAKRSDELHAPPRCCFLFPPANTSHFKTQRGEFPNVFEPHTPVPFFAFSSLALISTFPFGAEKKTCNYTHRVKLHQSTWADVYVCLKKKERLCLCGGVYVYTKSCSLLISWRLYSLTKVTLRIICIGTYILLHFGVFNLNKTALFVHNVFL